MRGGVKRSVRECVLLFQDYNLYIRMYTEIEILGMFVRQSNCVVPNIEVGTLEDGGWGV